MALAAKKAPRVTVNETLRDRAIAHAVMLEKLKTGEAQLVRDHFEQDVIPDLIDRLAKRLTTIGRRSIDTDSQGTQRLRDLLEFMQETIDAWASGLSSDLAKRSDQIAVSEAGWQHDLFQTVIPIRWDLVMPPTATVSAALTNSPIDGVLLKDIVSNLSAQSQRGLERATRLAISEGQTTPELTARMRKVGDLTSNTAAAVARTAVGHASAIGRDTVYESNSDLIKGVIWVDTLDTRTCPTCMALGGKTFDLGKGPRPPRHILCRCTTAPVLKSMAELGLPMKDYTPATRASMNGQVPANLTYNAWLKGQAASVQDEALGPTRGQLFRTGKISVTDFVSPAGDSYTLDQLRQREADVFAAAGL